MGPTQHCTTHDFFYFTKIANKAKVLAGEVIGSRFYEFLSLSISIIRPSMAQSFEGSRYVSL